MAKLVITVLRGGLAGQRFEFDDARVTIGRHPESALPLDSEKDRKASSHHAEIRRQGDQYLIRDLKATNGTFVDGGRIDDDEPIKSGTTITLGQGGPVLRIQVVGAAVDPSNPANTVDLVTDAPSPEIEVLGDRPVSDRPVSPSTGRTAYYRALMLETVKKSRRPLVALIAVLAVSLVVGGIVTFLLLRKQEVERKEDRRDSEQEIEVLKKSLQAQDQKIRGELVATTDSLGQLRLRWLQAQGKDKAELARQAKELEDKHASLARKLHKQQKDISQLEKSTNASEYISTKYERSLFMLVARFPSGLEKGFCTAFSIDRAGTLVTNAHCMKDFKKATGLGTIIEARMNKHPKRSYRVISAEPHSKYNGTVFSADVGIMKLDLRGDSLPITVELAPPLVLRNLHQGQVIYTMGFPGEVMNLRNPSADFRAAVISRLTDFRQNPGSGSTRRLVWHSALISKGTSGSPIFNKEGLVVAVNNGALGNRMMVIKRPDGTEYVDVVVSASGLNLGIRVDAVRDILRLRSSP
jgi:S1-C subfamily serine protease